MLGSLYIRQSSPSKRTLHVNLRNSLKPNNRRNLKKVQLSVEPTNLNLGDDQMKVRYYYVLVRFSDAGTIED